MTALLGLFPSFFPVSLPLSVFFSSFLSLPSPLPTLILSTSSADSIPPRLWPSKTEYPVLSGCHCLPAWEYQWPAAQSNQFLRGRSTVCLTSGSLIIVSERKLIDSNHHLASPSQKPWLLVFKVLPALSTAVCTPTPIETWIVASQWSWCSYFVNEVRRRGIISLYWEEKKLSLIAKKKKKNLPLLRQWTLTCRYSDSATTPSSLMGRGTKVTVNQLKQSIMKWCPKTHEIFFPSARGEPIRVAVFLSTSVN